MKFSPSSKMLILSFSGSVVMIISGFFVAYFGLQAAFQVTSMLMPMFIAIPSLIILKKITSFRTFLKIVVILSGFAFLIESLGIISGFPYGEFQYSELLGFKLAGLVPLNLPWAWIPLLLGAYVLSARFLKNLKTSSWIFLPLLGVFFLVCFDLILDPAAVLFQLWFYQKPGIYFGVPWSNFGGWILSGLIGLSILNHFLQGKSSKFLGLSAGWMVLFWSSAWTCKFFLNSGFTSSSLLIFFNSYYWFPLFIGLICSYLLLNPSD